MKPAQRLRRGRVVVLFVHTNGFKTTKLRILRLCATELMDGVRTGNEYVATIDPESTHGLEPAFQEQHPMMRTLLDEAVSGNCPRFKEAMEGLDAFLGKEEKTVVVSHGSPAVMPFVTFDELFIQQEMKRVEYGRVQLGIPVVNSMMFASACSKLQGHNLNGRRHYVTLVEWCKMLGIECHSDFLITGMEPARLIAQCLTNSLQLLDPFDKRSLGHGANKENETAKEQFGNKKHRRQGLVSH